MPGTNVDEYLRYPSLLCDVLLTSASTRPVAPPAVRCRMAPYFAEVTTDWPFWTAGASVSTRGVTTGDGGFAATFGSEARCEDATFITQKLVQRQRRYVRQEDPHKFECCSDWAVLSEVSSSARFQNQI